MVLVHRLQERPLYSHAAFFESAESRIGADFLADLFPRRRLLRGILSAAMQKARVFAAWLALAAWIVDGRGRLRARRRPARLPDTRATCGRPSDGLPEQTVQAFAQTPDGFLWIGTTGGLVRFDGVHFTVFDRQNTPALHENSVFCLMVAARWRSLDRDRGRRVGALCPRRVPLVDHARGAQQRLCADAGRGRAGKHLGGHGQRPAAAGGRPVCARGRDGKRARAGRARHLPDRDGNLWVGGSKLLRFNGKNVTEYTMRGEVSQNRVKSIVQTQDGTMWVGTVSGLNRMAPGAERIRARQRNCRDGARPAPDRGRRALDRNDRAGSLPISSREV